MFAEILYLAYQEKVLLSLFSVGQLVSSVVSQVDDDQKEKGKRKIWLSLRLSSLHKGFSLEAIQDGMVRTVVLGFQFTISLY